MQKYEKILNEMLDMNRGMISAAKQEKRIYKDLEKSASSFPIDESAEHSPRKLLQRDIKRMALLRLEDSARTESDFKEVIRVWNKNDSNRERKERYHEIGRSTVPLEYGSDKNGLVFPLPKNREIWRKMQKGDFLDAIFNCPFELHELVENERLSKAVKKLKPEHKELLFYFVVKNLSPQQIAVIKKCTDRNVRKVKTTIINKLRLEAGYE